MKNKILLFLNLIIISKIESIKLSEGGKALKEVVVFQMYSHKNQKNEHLKLKFKAEIINLMFNGLIKNSDFKNVKKYILEEFDSISKKTCSADDERILLFNAADALVDQMLECYKKEMKNLQKIAKI